MAEEVYRIEIPVVVEDQTNPALDQAQSRVTKFERGLERTQRQLDRMNKTRMDLILHAIDRASGIISTVHTRAMSLSGRTYHVTIKAIDLVTSPFRAIGRMLSSPLGMIGAGVGAAGMVGMPLHLAGSFEQAQIGMTTMLGSAEKAQQMIKDLVNFANVTPFEFPQLQKASSMLLAFGFDSKQIIPMLTSVGNAASGLGLGAEGIDRITLALGQMKAKGKVSADEMLQLTEAGIGGWGMLADAMGITQAQVMKMSEKGLIPASKAIDIILNGMNKKFPGMMEAQSHTLSGLLSTLKDFGVNKLLYSWGDGIRQALVPRLQSMVDWLTTNEKTVNGWMDTIKRAGHDLANDFLIKVEQTGRALQELTSSAAWQHADAFGKIGLAWDKIIQEPFEKWWNGSGQQWTIEVAAKIGHGMGSSIGSFLRTALGVTDSTKVETNPFINAGASAGTAFFNAFWDAFDADAIAKKTLDAFKNIAVDSINVLPFGKPATAGTYLEALLVAGVTAGALRGTGALIRGLRDVRTSGKFILGAGGKTLDWLKGLSGVNRPGWESLSEAGSLAKAAEPAAVASEVIKSVPGAVAGGSAEIATGGLLRSGLKIGGQTLGKIALPVALALDAYNIASAKPGAERARAVGGSIGGWGGFAAGSALGTAILPGIGSIVGGIVGALGGRWLGDVLGSKIAKVSETPEIGNTAATAYDAQQNYAERTYDTQMELARRVYDAQQVYAQQAYDAQRSMYQATKDTNAVPMMLVSIADAVLTAIGTMFNQALLQNAIDTGQVGHWEGASEGDAGISGAPHWVPAKTGGSGPQINVTVNYTPSYAITSKADAEDILQVVRDNHRQIAEDVTDEVALELEKSFQNTGYVRDDYAYGW